MNAAKVISFAPAMGARRPSDAKTGSASDTPGFQMSNKADPGNERSIPMWQTALRA